jgi:hypothetical protein
LSIVARALRDDTGGIMKLPRRRFLHLAADAAAFPAVPRIASAQTYPSRPVHLISGFPASSAADIVARLVVNRCRSGSANRSSPKTGQAPVATSPPR